MEKLQGQCPPCRENNYNYPLLEMSEVGSRTKRCPVWLEFIESGSGRIFFFFWFNDSLKPLRILSKGII